VTQCLAKYISLEESRCVA